MKITTTIKPTEIKPQYPCVYEKISSCNRGALILMFSCTVGVIVKEGDSPGSRPPGSLNVDYFDLDSNFRARPDISVHFEA